MKKEVVQKWVEALESGEYAQGTGHLNKNNTFCCLGVLCEIAAKGGVVLRLEEPSTIGAYCYGSSRSTAFLPTEVRMWLGVELGDPKVQGVCCTTLNDVQRKTFPEIAAMLREEIGLDPRQDVQGGEIL